MFTLSIFTEGKVKQIEIFDLIRQIGYYCSMSSNTDEVGFFYINIPNLNTSQLNELLNLADDNGAAFTEF